MKFLLSLTVGAVKTTAMTISSGALTVINLILEFLKTGAFAIGGGLATIPFLKEISEKWGWFTKQELLDFIAISESTPGPIGINIATYAGFKALSNEFNSNAIGILGGVITPISMVIPSVTAVLIVARVYEKFKTNKYVEASFAGIRASTPGLICGAMASVFLAMVWNDEIFKTTNNIFKAINKVEAIAFVAFVILIMKFKKIHPIFFIVAGAALGLGFGL
jgi:chromate transporter